MRGLQRSCGCATLSFPTKHPGGLRIWRCYLPIRSWQDSQGSPTNWRCKDECHHLSGGGFHPSDDQRTIGPIVDQLHSHVVNGRSPASEIWASWDANGVGAARLHALEPRHAFRSARSYLAEPRSVRALQRSCLDAAVVGAPPHPHASSECRLRTAWSTRSFARRYS